jgi:hypothetical protein
VVLLGFWLPWRTFLFGFRFLMVLGMEPGPCACSASAKGPRPLQSLKSIHLCSAYDVRADFKLILLVWDFCVCLYVLITVDISLFHISCILFSFCIHLYSKEHSFDSSVNETAHMENPSIQNNQNDQLCLVHKWCVGWGGLWGGDHPLSPVWSCNPVPPPSLPVRKSLPGSFLQVSSVLFLALEITPLSLVL